MLAARLSCDKRSIHFSAIFTPKKYDIIGNIYGSVPPVSDFMKHGPGVWYIIAEVRRIRFYDGIDDPDERPEQCHVKYFW